MRTFEYNAATLTAEQRTAIAAAEQTYANTLAEIDKEVNGIADRYYDADDDYSFGNPIMERVFARRRARAEQSLNDRIQEIVNGYITRVRRRNILRDLSGEIVAEGTRCGEYGRYFKTYDGKFVSCAKRIATYEKKGYKPFVQEIAEKVRRAGTTGNGDTIYETIGVISTTETLSTEICY